MRAMTRARSRRIFDAATHLAFYAGWPRDANALTVLKNTRESR